MNTIYKRRKNERGMVLLTCILMLSVVTIVAASIIGLSIAELKSSTFSSRAHRSFYEAEAGARHVINSINQDLRNGNITFASTPETINVNYSAPAGHEFDPVQALHRLDNNQWYVFTVTGRCANSKSVIEVTIHRPSQFGGIGIFGGNQVRFQPMVDIYSYRSEDLLNPTPADSTGEANVGSNGSIAVQPNVAVDGIFIIGQDELGFQTTGPLGYTCEYVDRIEEDPLGASNGPLAVAIAAAVSNNMNAASGIAGSVINLGAHASLTLTSGVYYLTQLEVGAHGTLNVDSSVVDPTIVYLQGPLRIQPNAEVNVTANSPRSFYIFSSDSEEVRIQPQNELKAFIYAPYATIRFQPQNDFYGMMWAQDVRLQPSGDVYIDVSLLDSFTASYVELAQWRRL
jgi:hypothetical protein